MNVGKGVRIGLDNLHIAVMTNEETEVYSNTLLAVKGAISAKVSPSFNTETLFADDQIAELATSLGAVEVELNIKDLPADVYNAIMGSTTDVNGVVVDNVADNPPYLAIGWRSRKSNKKYRYVWLFKGKFGPGEDEYNTKEDTPSFQTPTIKGTFIPRETDGNWRARVDEDDEAIPPALITGWFTKVYDGTAIV